MKKISPYIRIVITFAVVILVGTFLLMLPISSTNGHLSFVDALFMSTSSVCVTGLTVVPNIKEEITIFGKIVITFLIEIGGLSFITLATFVLTIFGSKINITDRYLLKEALNQNSLKGIIGFVKKIIFFSLAIQAFGVFLNCFALMPYYDGFWEILGVSIFHTVASFNNSGLDIFGSTSMLAFSHDVFLNINTMLLIILGGLGFAVLTDIIKTRSIRRLNINSKIVLISTTVLIIGGALFLKIANNNLTFLQAFFMSITSRTAGFTTVDCANLNPGEFSIITSLMFIGASPGSTGGGVKTSTFFVVLLAILSYGLNKKPTIFKRTIAKDTIMKSFALVTSAIITCTFAVMIISIIEPNIEHEKIIFEVVSAFSTTGLSMGITTSLSNGSLIILVFMMFFGRLGPLTIISLINRNWHINGQNDSIKYVEEKVVIG